MSGIPYAETFNATADMGIDPRLVAAVAWVESGGFDPDVIACRRASRAGALGIMQYMPGTARGRGIDPCDPSEAIPAAARFLLELRGMFDDWEVALAGYNAGPYGDVAACRCVPRNGETEGYVPKVMNKWQDYKRQFPSGEVAGGAVAVGDCPIDLMGGTEPISDGRATDATLRMANAVVACFGRGRWIDCYDRRTQADGREGPFEHPRGRACDFMVTGGGVPTEAERRHGEAMAEWVAAHAEELNVLYVIWYNKSWNPRDGYKDWSTWRSYGCGGCGPTRAHYNHVHISVRLMPGDPGSAQCVPGIPCTE